MQAEPRQREEDAPEIETRNTFSTMRFLNSATSQITKMVGREN